MEQKSDPFLFQIWSKSNPNRFQNIVRSEKILRRVDDVYLIDSLGNVLLSDVRDITEAEREFFLNFLNSNPNVSAEMVYMSFALSNEYQFY